jgi:hypothetical protein
VKLNNFNSSQISLKKAYARHLPLRRLYLHGRITHISNKPGKGLGSTENIPTTKDTSMPLPNKTTQYLQNGKFCKMNKSDDGKEEKLFASRKWSDEDP